MKVGLINFSYGYNYGAVLQCLALSKVLSGIGHDVEVVNYCPENFKPLPFWLGWGTSSGGGFKRIESRWIEVLHGPATRRKFTLFKKTNMKFTGRCQTLGEVEQAAQKFDVLVVGSDQVWNECFFNNPVFFIGFSGSSRKCVPIDA